MPKCEHCGDEYDKRGIAAHEAHCDDNPANGGDPDPDPEPEPEPEPEPDPDPEPEGNDDSGGEPEPDPGGPDDDGSEYDPLDGLNETNGGGDESGETDESDDAEYRCGECGAALEYLQEQCECGVRPAWSVID